MQEDDSSMKVIIEEKGKTIKELNSLLKDQNAKIDQFEEKIIELLDESATLSLTLEHLENDIKKKEEKVSKYGKASQDNERTIVKLKEENAEKESSFLSALIAIDAMTLEKRVRITKTGYIEGTLENMKITDKDALLYRNDTEEYNDFLNKLDAEKKLIKAVFVILLVPLAEMVSPPLQIIFPANVDSVAAVLDLPRNMIRCEVMRLGGGFGGKQDRPQFYAAQEAVASYVTKRPIRLVMQRQDDLATAGMRHEYVTDYNSGCDENGMLTKMDDNYPRVFFGAGVLY